jgi:hypothetical protein
VKSKKYGKFVRNSKHIFNNVIYAIAFFFFLIPNLLLSKEITVLPASISGEIPSSVFGTKNEAGTEFARLTRHYLKRNFQTEITDALLTESFLTKENIENDMTLSEPIYDVLCLEWDSNFISKDYIDFGKPTLIQTEVYNCKNKLKTKVQSKLVTNPILAIEMHVEKTFRFLSPKYFEKKLNEDKDYYEVHFFCDTNGAYAYYRKDFLKSILSLVDKTNLFLGVTILRKNKNLTLPPTLEHAEIKNLLEEKSWSGSNQSDVLLGAIQSLKSKFGSSKKKSRKLFLLLSGSAKEKSNDIINALNDLRQLGIELYIIIPNHTNLETIRNIQKIGRMSSSKILGITDYQRLGTEDGYIQIFLNQFNLYYTTDEVSQPFQLDSPPFKKYDASIVRQVADTITPYNMNMAYEKISETKVLEKLEVQTDIESLIGNEIIKPNDNEDKYQAILVETKGEAIWLKVPLEIQVTAGKEYAIRTSMKLDSFTSYGVQNIPSETFLSKPNISFPKTLLIQPSKAKQFLIENKRKTFSGYIKGVVTVVKKK